MECPEIITIVGPTASGKTRLAALLASQVSGEIISADSRQVYRGMNLGTGKDYADYIVDGVSVPVHLIDIANPGEEYNVFRYRQDFDTAFNQIRGRKKLPILCGGTGLYIEAVLGGFPLANVPKNQELRKSLETKNQDELTAYLRQLKPVHNTTDMLDRERTLRAIEIAFYELHNPAPRKNAATNALIFGVNPGREQVRQRITNRLQQRLEQGMVDEVRLLIAKGISPEKLDFYGLEYRYISRYLTGQIGYDQMFSQLNTAIHQFAKRQMTWFRRMERNGFEIIWLDGALTVQERLQVILGHLS